MVFVAGLTLAIFLPWLYWIAFEKPVRKPFVQYSCINHQFMIQRIGEKKWEDATGKQYSRDEYEQMLPLMFLKQLLASGTMPDSINGTALEVKLISRDKSFFRLNASEADAPAPRLYPLFESRSGRAQLELPEDFFRITWRIDFIDAATNQMQEEKSQMFSAALFQKGFAFPAKLISGLPTPRKSCDEGYLIIDKKDQLFHLKMIKGKPFVRKVEVPDGLRFRQISCVDFKNKEFYAYLFSDKNEIFILTQNDYNLVKWPVEGYDPANCDLKIYGDLFNHTVLIETTDHLKAVVLDREFKLVDTYTEKWPVKEDLKEGKVFASVFPAQVSMTSDNSKFVRFYFTRSGGFNWLFLNFLLTLLHFGWLYWLKKPLKSHVVDLGIVAVGGIYGFIAIHLFQNKFFD